MLNNTVENYLKFITPAPGDPTYSLLKAHLLFEELLRAYLIRTLPHPDALDGARLTFVQLLAVARACSDVPPGHWSWTAVGKLNKLRNMLSHEAAPKALSEKMSEYISFIVEHTGAPLPQPVHKQTGASTSTSAAPEPLYLAVDLATIGLYYSVSDLLGFDAAAALNNSDAYTKSLRHLLIPSGAQGAG